MSLFKPKPTSQQVAVEAATERLDVARDKRKSAMARLLQRLDEISIDVAIESVGKDIGGRDD